MVFTQPRDGRCRTNLVRSNFEVAGTSFARAVTTRQMFLHFKVANLVNLPNYNGTFADYNGTFPVADVNNLPDYNGTFADYNGTFPAVTARQILSMFFLCELFLFRLNRNKQTHTVRARPKDEPSPNRVP